MDSAAAWKDHVSACGIRSSVYTCRPFPRSPTRFIPAVCVCVCVHFPSSPPRFIASIKSAIFRINSDLSARALTDKRIEKIGLRLNLCTLNLVLRGYHYLSPSPLPSRYVVELNFGAEKAKNSTFFFLYL